MKIFPAIDILDGKVVRLFQGRLDAVTVYNDDPVDQAKKWAAAGAEWLHVVDLDGAVLGAPKNIEAVEAITRAVDVPVQLGGGLRTMESITRVFRAGVKRAVLGTALIKEPNLVAEACARYPGGIVAGVDARDGKVAVEGWRQGTEFGVLEIVHELELLGVSCLAYTDIGLDGTQQGINYGAYKALAGRVSIPIIASGGVSTLRDVRDLCEVGEQLEGVIIGTALYTKKFTLEDAIEMAHCRDEEAEEAAGQA